MVIGHGLMATAFKKFTDDDSVIIFASGVSNSGEISQTAFDREKKLVEDTLREKGNFIYFSTCSVYDSSLVHTPYILHKKEIEAFIRANSADFIIFRLPIVVGKSDNPYTLTNAFFNKIKNREPITVFANACRYLIDIEDVQQIISFMLENRCFQNETVDVALHNRIAVTDLIKIFEEVVQVKANMELLPKGNCYEVPGNGIAAVLEKMNFELLDSYNYSLINKYYRLKSF